jgi:phosphoribosylformimino-5-aminoimidazole carboxamide ribotide isomerase
MPSTPARIVPVIDLLNGQVVRGVKGDRKAYRPIVSALCGSSDPVSVARQLLDHCAARQLYVADLDALMGGSVQIGLLQTLLEELPEIDELWLDGGFADAAAAQLAIDAMGPQGIRLAPVFGSESLSSRTALERCFDRRGPFGERALLSLDRRDGQRLDVAGSWDAPELWPPRVIVMTLERVGAGTGPDLQTLREMRSRSPTTTLIGAGGLRSEADLDAAGAAGAAVWLVASALHDLQVARLPR